MTEMIDAVTACARESVPSAPVHVSHKNEEPSNGVSIRFLSLTSLAEPRLRDRQVSALAVNLLLIVRAGDPITEMLIVGDLALAAIESETIELISDTAAITDACRALGIVGPVALILRVEVRRERALPLAPLVREPVTPHVAPLAELEGVVRAPSGQPVAGAIVNLTGSGHTMPTDEHGRFAFAVASGRSVHAVVRARGFSADTDLVPGEIATITLPSEA